MKDKNPNKAKPFLPVEQLTTLLRRYPADPLAIEGVILDYIGQSGASLDQVFELNRSLYTDLFTGAHANRGMQLVKCVAGTEDEAARLRANCRDIYPAITRMLDEIGTSANRKRALLGDLIVRPEELIGQRVKAVIWHISDLHFGRFNKIENDPHELACMLAKIVAEYPALRPDILVITGDVTSVAAEAEFAQSENFCKSISQVLWDGPHPEKIIVVPGNHDVTWLPDGTADRMSRFRSRIGNGTVCISPFGPAAGPLASGRVVVNRRVDPSADLPPIAEVLYPNLGLRFLLLVSGYYAGAVPEEIRTMLEANACTDENFFQILRVDDGAVNRAYLLHLASLEARDDFQSIAVIHHNPVQYGVEVCTNRFAKQLLETLSKKGVPLILHGHTHLVDDPGSRRPVIPGESYPVPSPTLCGVTSSGGSRGINIHLVGEGTNQRTIGTLLWSMSGSQAFNIDGAMFRYKFNTNAGDLNVEHSG